MDGTETREATVEMTPLDPWIGKRIDGRYLIEKIIGSGGMGVVYEARHESLKKRMAIKVLRPDLAKVAVVVERFLREAQTASSLGHPNIATVTDFGHLPDGSPYFVMELLEGRSLADRIDEGPLAIDEALSYADQIAAALTAAHEHGIVHRDLKPDNVFLSGKKGETPVVKLLDFGIAKAGGELSRITQTGTLFGTPHYMSPEQAAGQNVDRRTDVYAFGVIVYEMLTGDVPFDADTFLGVLAKHMFEPPRPLSTNDARLGVLEGALLRALAKRPDDRTPDAKTLAAELRAAAGGMPLADRVSATLPDLRFSTPPAHLRPPPSSRPPPPKSIRTGALAVTLIGALGVGGFAAWKALATRTQSAAAPAVTTSTILAPAPIVEAPRPGEPVAQMIRITSMPEGALVTIEGAVIGHTPVTIPRPTHRVEATLDLAGHLQKRVTLSELAAEEIAFTLDAASRETATSMRTTPGTSAPSLSTDVTESAPAAMAPRMTELVDPWR